MNMTLAAAAPLAFGNTPYLNIHFQILFLDGVYVTTGEPLSIRRGSRQPRPFEWIVPRNSCNSPVISTTWL